MNEKVELIECIRTFQGEGPNIGKKMVLCRFKLCNRKPPCLWCDTIVKMRVTEEMEFTLEKLQTIINNYKCGLMITGGEPTFDKNFNYTVKMLNKLEYPFADIETNGYNINNLLKEIDGFKNINVNISPKVFSDDDIYHFEQILKHLINDRRVFFKIVVPDVNNDKVLNLINDYGYNNITYLMPKGKDSEELKFSYPYVLDLAEKFSMNITTRLHLTYQIV